jgi:multiple sugar transport system substrate-binding protein
VSEFALIGAIAPLPTGQRGLLDDAYQPHDLRIGGRDYAVPWTLDTGIQYYRRDILARAGYAAPPADLDGWRDMLRAVKRVQGDGYAVLMQLDWPDYLMHIADQQDDPLLRDGQSRGNFRSPGFRAALAFYASLFAERLAPMVSSTEAVDPPGDFRRGWVAIYNSGSWVRAELLRHTAWLPRERWSAAPLPTCHHPRAHTVAGAVLCVSPSAADPARAWSLVRYLTAVPTELFYHRITGTLPSRPSAWDAPTIARDPVMAVFRQAVEHGAPNRNLPEWDRITPQVQLVAEQVVRGSLSIDAAVAEMDRRADAILAKRRWLLDKGRIA